MSGPGDIDPAQLRDRPAQRAHHRSDGRAELGQAAALTTAQINALSTSNLNALTSVAFAAFNSQQTQAFTHGPGGSAADIRTWWRSKPWASAPGTPRKSRP